MTERVVSRDGTPITYARSGQGPLLLLVHGTGADHETTWKYLAPTLEGYFTVLGMDRRGRRESGDSGYYAIEKEFEDIASVIHSQDGPVSVLAHGYGALCALEACLLTPNVGKLVLYEPGVSRHRDEVVHAEALERMDDLLTKGDNDGILTVLMRDIAGKSNEEISQLRSQPTWIGRLTNARTVPREFKADLGYTFDPERFSILTTPTMLLVGSESPAAEHEDANALAAAIPNAQVVVLDGQEDTAMYTAPDLVLRIVGDFLMD